MIKIIIGFIAFIFIGLMAYLYTGNNSQEIPKHVNKTRVAEKIIAQTKSTVNKAEKTISKINTLTSEDSLLKISLNKATKAKQSKIHVQQGLTLESIENSNLSHEEKELLYGDLVYINSEKVINPQSLTKKQILHTIMEDQKNGFQ